MPSAVSPNPRAGSTQPDELDRLLDFDNAAEDFMNDIASRDDRPNGAAVTEQPSREEDQEVQVKKKRQPVPKLDENRLLSDAGIPKLRKISKSRLKFRGKGHEFTDITHLLNTYQLWLDDLYPRAKFRDALTMVEKVGHSKRMQVMRRAWLDDTKPSRRELTPPPKVVEMSGANGGGDEEEQDSPSGPVSRPADQAARQRGISEQPQDDELDALLAESGHTSAIQRQNAKVPQSGGFETGEPDEDELDALLANEQPPVSGHTAAKPTSRGPFIEEPDDDELDALLDGDSSIPQKPVSDSSATREQPIDDFADDEEAMDEMWS